MQLVYNTPRATQATVPQSKPKTKTVDQKIDEQWSKMIDDATVEDYRLAELPNIKDGLRPPYTQDVVLDYLAFVFYYKQEDEYDKAIHGEKSSVPNILETAQEIVLALKVDMDPKLLVRDFFKLRKNVLGILSMVRPEIPILPAGTIGIGDIVYPRTYVGLQLSSIPGDGVYKQGSEVVGVLRGQGVVIDTIDGIIDYDQWGGDYIGIGKLPYRNCLVKNDDVEGWCGSGALVRSPEEQLGKRLDNVWALV